MLSLVLSLLMIISIVPLTAVNAFAESHTQKVTITDGLPSSMEAVAGTRVNFSLDVTKVESGKAFDKWEVVKGGVLVLTNGLKVFVPASMTSDRKVEDLNTLLKKDVRFKIIEINDRRRRAVGSIRAVLNDEKKAKQEEFWANVEVGKVYHGEVKSLTSYGAFVDLGGVDGMIHISELSWNRIKHPSEVLKVGDVVNVKVLSVDPEKNRISLTMKF